MQDSPKYTVKEKHRNHGMKEKLRGSEYSIHIIAVEQLSDHFIEISYDTSCVKGDT